MARAAVVRKQRSPRGVHGDAVRRDMVVREVLLKIKEHGRLKDQADAEAIRKVIARSE